MFASTCHCLFKVNFISEIIGVAIKRIRVFVLFVRLANFVSGNAQTPLQKKAAAQDHFQ